MHERQHVNDRDVELLIAQCRVEAHPEEMWQWSDAVIREAVRRVDAVFPELAVYAVSRGYPEHLFTRDDVPPESMRAVWSLLMIDMPESAGIERRWWASVGRFLSHPAWRASAHSHLLDAIPSVRASGELEPEGTEGENRRLAAAAYLVTEPTESLPFRAQLLRRLEAYAVGSPLVHLALTEPVLRAAYQGSDFMPPDTADALLNYPCVLRDPAWCHGLALPLLPHLIADLPSRALELLPPPVNTLRATEILQTCVLSSPAVTRLFAHYLQFEHATLLPIVTRADVLRCIAASADNGDRREQLLRLLPQIPR